jgi:hypothetical protein
VANSKSIVTVIIHAARRIPLVVRTSPACSRGSYRQSLHWYPRVRRFILLALHYLGLTLTVKVILQLGQIGELCIRPDSMGEGEKRATQEDGDRGGIYSTYIGGGDKGMPWGGVLGLPPI